MERARVGWAGEYARHEEAVERMETRMGAIRTGWAGEVKTHEAKRREMRREMADIRMGWEGEVREHEVRRREMETEMSDIRAGWVVESREHDKLRERMLEEREQWEADRRERERREAEEKRRKEEQERAEEEKKRAGLLWENLRGGEHCLRYGTREYTAKLGNVPTGYDALHGCRETPVSIHGVKLSTPNFCDDKVRCFAYLLVDCSMKPCTRATAVGYGGTGLLTLTSRAVRRTGRSSRTRYAGSSSFPPPWLMGMLSRDVPQKALVSAYVAFPLDLPSNPHLP